MQRRRTVAPHTALALTALLGACAAPGTEVAPRTDDFAFLEMQLEG